MRNGMRLFLAAFALVFAVGCGSGDQSAPSSSAGPAADTPAAGPGGASGAPSLTPGADARGEGSAAAPAKEPIITTMPMDVPSGTELVLTLETPVSSETAKPDQPVRATLAKPVIVAGMEAHICVNQTVHDLLAAGLHVHLLTDCITSRRKSDRKTGLTKMQASGAIVSSVEMALFELMRDARHEQFKAVQGLIK